MPSRALLVAALAASLAACTSGRVAKLETRLAAQDERIAELEEQVEQLQGTAAVVEELVVWVGRMAQMLGLLDDPSQGPSPDEVYAVPIEGDPRRGPDDARITIVEAADFG